jgi:hypothetical protein
MPGDPTYSVEEARDLLPQVRAIILQLAVERRRADAAHAELHHRLRGDGSGREALEESTAELRAGVRALLVHLEDLGVVVRDLDEGLVDIPTVRDGEPAWLCWRLSDADLGYWHTTREGFASRRPL